MNGASIAPILPTHNVQPFPIFLKEKKKIVGYVQFVYTNRTDAVYLIMPLYSGLGRLYFQPPPVIELTGLPLYMRLPPIIWSMDNDVFSVGSKPLIEAVLPGGYAKHYKDLKYCFMISFCETSSGTVLSLTSMVSGLTP